MVSINLMFHEYNTEYEEDIRSYFVTDAATQIFNDYINCYKEITEIILNKNITNDEIKQIALKHNLDENFKNLRQEIIYKIADKEILFHEYRQH